MLISVALLAESVDRNANPGSTSLTFPGSLSLRRAWIEIFVPFDVIRPAIVALLAESVDRNSGGAGQLIKSSSRSPCGERG